MTTIVFDGKTLAVDSQTTSARPTQPGQKCGHCQKDLKVIKHTDKLRFPKEVVDFQGEHVLVVTGAGRRSWTNGIFRAICSETDLTKLGYILSGFDDEPDNRLLNQLDGEALVLTVTGKLWSIRQKRGEIKTTQITEFPYHAGSGSDVTKVAIGYMGLGVLDAVALAVEIDSASGGRVCYVSIGDTKQSVKEYTAAEIAAFKTKPTPVKKPVKKVKEVAK